MSDREYKEDKVEWWKNVWGFDMTPIRDLAMVEPLVDTVESKSVLCDPVPILRIDINTVTKSQIDFSSPFTLRFNRQDFCHALVAFFDVQFTKCHTPLTLPTGPFDKYTHWKQNIFYLDEELVVMQGETVTGRITVSRNGKNPRDIDIRFETQFRGRKCQIEQARDYKMR